MSKIINQTIFGFPCRGTRKQLDEMYDLFSYIPQACENTIKIVTSTLGYENGNTVSEITKENFKVIFRPDNYKKISRAYENNLRTECEIEFGDKDFLWYEIGDSYNHDYFLKKDWDGFYKVEKEILLPNFRD